jgi:tRNA(Ile)-lysidine synthase TilS/MesJ
MIFKNSQDIIEFNDITIPTHTKKIGIKLSGGADSSMVCYMLVKYLKETRPDVTIYPITAVVLAKPYQKIFAKQIVNKISELLDYKNFGEHFVAYTKTRESHECLEVQKTLLNWLYDTNRIDMHLNGISAVPNIEDAPELCKEIEETGPTDNRFKETIKKNQRNGIAFSPFINTDKKGIAEYYTNLGVLEELFPLTRSCEEKTTDFTQHCGNCWWCKERYWAFGRYA